MKRSHLAIRSIAAIFISQAWLWILGLIEVAILPRYLGSTGIGKLSFAGAVLSIAGVLVSFGGATQIIREVASGQEDSDRLLTTVLIFRTLVGIPIIAAICLVTHFLVHDRLITILLIINAIATYLTWLLDAALAFRQAHTHFGNFATSQMLAKTAGTATRIGSVFTIAPLSGKMIGAAMGGVVQRLVGLTVAWTKRGSRLRLVRVHRADFRRFLRAGSPYFLYSISVWMYGTPTTTYMLCAFASYAANGWYVTSERLLSLVFVIPSAIVSVMLPILTRSFEKSPDDYTRLAFRVISPGLVIAIPFALLFILRPEAIVYALGYPRDFVQHVPAILRISGFFLLIRWSSMYYGMLLIASNQVNKQARVALYAAPLNLILTAILIILFQRWMDNGAVGGVIAAELTEVFIVNIYIRYMKVPGLVRVNLKAIGRGLLAAVVPALILELPMPNRISLIGWVLLAVLAYIPAAIWAGAIRRDQVAPIFDIVRNRFRNTSAEDFTTISQD